MTTNNNLIRNYFLETNDSEWNLYDYLKFRYKYNSSKFTDKKQEHCFFYNKLKEKYSDVRNWVKHFINILRELLFAPPIFVIRTPPVTKCSNVTNEWL